MSGPCNDCYNFIKHTEFHKCPPFHHTFFCNAGIVTRCPLELKMKRKKEGEEWYGKISYQDHEEELDDPAEVEKKIREGAANGNLEHLHQKSSTDGASY